MPSAEHVQARIFAGLPDAQVVVIDTTGTGDHFRAVVESATFQGLSRIDQHRRVYDTVRAEIADGSIHALSIETRVPAS